MTQNTWNNTNVYWPNATYYCYPSIYYNKGYKPGYEQHYGINIEKPKDKQEKEIKMATVKEIKKPKWVSYKQLPLGYFKDSNSIIRIKLCENTYFRLDTSKVVTLTDMERNYVYFSLLPGTKLEITI